MFTEYDSYLFHEGTLYDAYHKFGAHPCEEEGVEGVRFAVWAEHAKQVSVAIFDPFQGNKIIPMEKTQPGIWEVFVPEIQRKTCYKYLVDGADGVARWKADPYAFYSELRPANGSIVWGLNDYSWTDQDYYKKKYPKEALPARAEQLQQQMRESRARRKKETKESIARLEQEQKDFEALEKEAAQNCKKTEKELANAKKELARLEKNEKKTGVDTQKERIEQAEEALKLLEETQSGYQKDIEDRKQWIKDTKAWLEVLLEREKTEPSREDFLNKARADINREQPMSIYEVHLGSWKKDFRLNPDGYLNYRQLADELADYVSFMGFTHVELMGICEYPYDGSWGYQVTGYYSPSSRHGTPEDLKYLINTLHERGIGVIVDWVPAHYPKDAFGLSDFDGSDMYESADPLLAEYPEWGTKAFDHSKPEVRNFLISSALYWVREFHADALRVDAVAAMLYTNFSRAQWRPNKFGGTQNLDSIAFLKQLNEAVVNRTGAFLIAEDSSEVQGITKPVDEDGLGFLFKWNMGWMNDTLRYYGKDPIYRRWHFGELTHTTDYVYTEYFINVLSHDEVVHLKKPMLYKMPGAIPDKLSGLKNLYTYQFTHPGKKLLFMGQEFAEDREWDENREINWYFAEETWHRDVLLSVKRLNEIYSSHEVLYKDSLDQRTIEWVNREDKDRGIMAYIRKKVDSYDGALLVILNTTPVQYDGYTCGIPRKNAVSCIFSTYDTTPGYGEEREILPIKPEKEPCDGYDYQLRYDLRPNEALIFEL